MMPLIHLDNVSIRHDEHVVLEHLSTEVNEGELVYLIGKTGSGKSSLLRTLYGDLSLTSGQGSVCGHDLAKLKPRTVHKLRRKLGMVFQDFGLLQDRSLETPCPICGEACGRCVASAWPSHAHTRKRCLRSSQGLHTGCGAGLTSRCLSCQ